MDPGEDWPQGSHVFMDFFYSPRGVIFWNTFDRIFFQKGVFENTYVFVEIRVLKER